MILDIRYPSHENERQTNELLGRPFSLIQRLKLGGIGSPKMKLVLASEKIKSWFSLNQDTIFASIELRPKGIIVGITQGLIVINWLIPFYRLNIYKNADQLSIHAEGHVVKLKAAFGTHLDKKFLQKLLDQQIDFQRQYDLPQ